MDPLLLIIIVVVVLVVLYLLFRRSQPAPPPANGNGGDGDSTTFTFDTERDALVPTVARKVTIVAPSRTIGQAKHKVTVEPRPLKDVGDWTKPPDGKGIDELVVLVINPAVRDDVTKEELYDFPTALEYTVQYLPEDAAKSTLDADGKPRLSIITGYSADDGWKWERHETTVTPDSKTGGGTLTAKINQLHPKDPQWIGRP